MALRPGIQGLEGPFRFQICSYLSVIYSYSKLSITNACIAILQKNNMITACAVESCYLFTLKFV